MNQEDKKQLVINFVSTQETNNLMAEIYYGSFAIATVVNENSDFEIQFFSDYRINSGLEDITVNLTEFIEILEKAKALLKKGPPF